MPQKEQKEQTLNSEQPNETNTPPAAKATKPKPPTCRELQTRINDLQKAITQLQNRHSRLESDKVSVKDSWTVTAAVQTGLETAQKYYERAEEAYNKIGPTFDIAGRTHTQALETLSTAMRLTREIEKYAALPWYRRIFSAPHFSAKEKS